MAGNNSTASLYVYILRFLIVDKKQLYRAFRSKLSLIIQISCLFLRLNKPTNQQITQ